jgi:uncharacterized iron-regulated protein
MNSLQRISAAVCTILVSLSLCFAAQRLDLTIFDTSHHKQPLSAVTQQLSDKRAVFIGENHERYDNHLDQLEIIKALHEAAQGRWVIGIEYIQRRFQPFLDAYIDNKIDEREFLKQTEYFERWGYDYRLYRPIFQYARDEHIPIIALNAERELTDAVDKAGLAGLSAADRARLPEHIENPDKDYRDRLHKVFEEHPGGGSFDRFVEIQSIWDETMAETVADYLSAHPDKAMIVLAGEGHIAFASSIPDRVKHRLPGISTAILAPAEKGDENLQSTDYVVISPKVSLPASGKMGVTMDTGSGVRVKSVSPNSAAAKAGIQPGDRITTVDDHSINSLTDFRLALLEKKPGEQVRVSFERGTEQTTVQLTLQK